MRAVPPSSASLLEAPRHLRPVDDVPPGLDVLGAAVLVLEVVGVLPDVEPEQRHVAIHDRRVLVRKGLDRDAGPVPDQPRPTTAEARDRSLRERLLELAEIADCLGERAVRLPAAVRAHHLPEHAVVRVAADVVANGGADVLRNDLDARQDVLDRAAVPLGALERLVRVVDVSLVVLVVVDAHRLLVDVRLERVVRVGQIRNLERHSFLLFSRSYPMTTSEGMSARNLYVTAMEPDSGKSVVSLGLMELLSGRVERLGFFRPVVAGEPDQQAELMRARYGAA